jgi:hypothetical protein
MRIIAGSGRSGTTWVLDCLADANDLRPMFEPLHQQVTPLGPKYAYKTIVPGERFPELEAYLERIARGDYSSWWVTYRGRRDLLIPSTSNLRSREDARRMYWRWRKFLKDRAVLRRASQRQGTLIKMIRANLALGWMAKTLGSRAILLLRHPCAVVESQWRLGPIWDPAPILDRFRADARLEEISGGRYRELLETRLSPIESLTLVWAIENQIPVERATQYGYSVIPYEDLADEAKRPWQRICASLALAALPEKSRVRRPSQQASRRTSFGYSASPREPSWMGSLATDDLHKIQRLLDKLECRLYDVTQSGPLQQGS